MTGVNLQDEARRESALFVVVMLLLGMLGPTVFLGLPAIVGQVERHWGFGEAALGLSSFVEVLGESTGTLLVASLPASQIEVGGEGGQEALARLKQTFSRVESSWRPASQEESYEIVRRRLFKEIPGDKFHHRDNTLKQFAKLYRENANDSRKAARTRITGANWRKHIRSIPSCSTSSTRAGVRSKNSNAPAAFSASWRRPFTSCG